LARRGRRNEEKKKKVSGRVRELRGRGGRRVETSSSKAEKDQDKNRRER
jgi:hypothetical protein